MARGNGENPEVPRWLKEEYFAAIEELAKLGSTEILRGERERGPQSHPQCSGVGEWCSDSRKVAVGLLGRRINGT
jgi:hypothetical protein